MECWLKECTFNDDHGCCTAPSLKDVDEEVGYGLSDDCPLTYDPELRDEFEAEIIADALKPLEV